MPNRKRRNTKAEQKINESIDIPKQYDKETWEGEEWKIIFSEILNKRYSEGWKYVPPYYRIGTNDSKTGSPAIYSVLYEKMIGSESVVAL